MKCKIHLIMVDDIVKLLNLIILTGKIRGERPVSAMLISDIEMGKTEMLDIFRKMDNVIWANDLSVKPIVNSVLPEIQNGKTHIIIPDILTVLSHNKQVVKSVVATLNMLIEEGITNIMFYGSERKFDEPIRAGVIFAITKDAFNYRRDYFRSIGFISRCIPVTFSYSDRTIDEIHDYIASGCPVAKSINVMTGGKKSMDVSIGQKSEQKMIKIMAISKKDRNSTGFRVHKHIRTLCKAHAIYSGHKFVTKTDIDEIERLMGFMNYDYTKL
jgi:hypothetical protein